MRRIVADIETDGLLPQLTKVHSLVLRDLEGGAVLSCADQPGYKPITAGLDVLTRAERIYFHNGIGFDIPALRKVYPRWVITEDQIRDTLIMARHRWAHIKDEDYARCRRGRLPKNLIGSHSLEAWGHRLGVLKGDYGQTTDWAAWTREMQQYCEQDTEVGKALVVALRKAALSPEAIETEHELAWYLEAQQRNGVPFNFEKATRLAAMLAGKRDALGAQLKEEFGGWWQPGKLFTPARDNARMGYVKGAVCQKIEWTEFNPKSNDHITDRLMKLYGWTPTEFTPTGKPKVDGDILKAFPYKPAPLIAEYLLVGKRLQQIAEGREAWLRWATPDATTGAMHIYGRVNQTGCITHRASHSSPNLGQVVKVTSPYGMECRELFVIPDSPKDPWVMLGTDVSSLELRCLAHYMAKYDNGAYGRTVTEGRNEDGTDIHSVNRDALELAGSKGRDAAKTFIYAYLYGAGDEKLGSIIEPTAAPERQKVLGKKLRATFERNTPALGYLVADVKRKAKKDGWLKLVDGRRVYTRSDHSALNSLLQGTGAVICKRWIVVKNRRYRKEFGEQSWSGLWASLLWVHDELETAVRRHIAARAAQIDVEAIESLTEHFGFRVPLTGESKVGITWADVH